MLLEINNLSISFPETSKPAQTSHLRPVKDMSLQVNSGQVVAMVGASGAGKTLLSHALLGILPQDAVMEGQIQYKGANCSPRCFKELRGKEIALIPQSVNYLNPLKSVGKQIHRSVQLSGHNNETARQSCDSILDRYLLGRAVKKLLPFQVSGGMAKRILTATATAGKADLIIADEPTTGLDPEACKQTLNHMRELAQEGRGVLFITHDLESAAKVADVIVVVYEGVTMDIFHRSMLHGDTNTLHPYTRALWNSLPQNGFTPLPKCKDERQNEWADSSHTSCPYYLRCEHCSDDCGRKKCQLISFGTRQTRCSHVAGC